MIKKTNEMRIGIVSIFGKEPLCNGRSERAPHLGSFCFPLCWRCTSILIGIALLNWVDLSWFFSHLIIGILLSLGLIVPCVVDGLRQYYQKCESTNERRIVTGILAGCGFNVSAATLQGFLLLAGIM